MVLFSFDSFFIRNCLLLAASLESVLLKWHYYPAHLSGKAAAKGMIDFAVLFQSRCFLVLTYPISKASLTHCRSSRHPYTLMTLCRRRHEWTSTVGPTLVTPCNHCLLQSLCRDRLLSGLAGPNSAPYRGFLWVDQSSGASGRRFSDNEAHQLIEVPLAATLRKL